MSKKTWTVTFEIWLEQSAETSEEALTKAGSELSELLATGLNVNDFFFTEPVELKNV